jgi:SAM-dependent methyltransferase
MSSPYRFDQRKRVYYRPEAGAFGYSDSNEAEERIGRIVMGASDLSSGSEELASSISDWASLYHLSPARCDLLRPVEELLTGRVIEVGAGCGALTRFLAERAASVVAVEGSMRRAEIAAARCAGIETASVYCDSFERFEYAGAFDVVACIGVIEYANRFFGGAGGFERMLRRMAGFLSPAGCLLIAIENRMGLKYFAGAPEDHISERFAGINNLYTDDSALTLGKGEWEQCLRRNSLEAVQFLYPMPDYKQPGLILTDGAFDDPELNVETLLRNQPAPTQDQDFERLFSEQMAWPVVVRNGLARDLANSFLILARRAGAPGPAWHPSALVYTYANNRRRAYSKETTIVRRRGSLTVVRRRTYPDSAGDPAYLPCPCDEPYLPGTPYVDELYPILNSRGWTLGRLAEWARPWVEFLKASAGATGELRADFVDCVPFNVMRLPDNTLAPFDLEYKAGQPLDPGFVIFRGLWGSLHRVRTCAPPGEDLDLGLANLSFAVMERLGFDVAQARTEALIEKEASLRHAILGVPAAQCDRNIRSESLVVRQPGSDSPDVFQCQVFWGSGNTDFREEDSARATGEISARRQILRMPIAPGTAPAALRLDPADRPGVVHIFSIRLLDAEGKQAWEWDLASAEANAAPKQAMRFLPAGQGRGGIIAHLDTDDPAIILPVPGEVLRCLEGGGELEVQMAWIGLIGRPAETAPVPAETPGDDSGSLKGQVRRLTGYLTQAESAVQGLEAQFQQCDHALPEAQGYVAEVDALLKRCAAGLARAEEAVRQRVDPMPDGRNR